MQTACRTTTSPPAGGRPIGNFPQRYSHVGLVTAALGPARAQGARS